MNPYPKPVKKEKPKPQKIKPRSDKRAKLENVYQKLRIAFLEENPYCKRCGKKSEDLHHAGKRSGRMLIATAYFMALCRKCHTWVHENSKEAKEQGYLIKI